MDRELPVSSNAWSQASERSSRELAFKDQAPTPKVLFRSAGSVGVTRLASEPVVRIDSS